MIFFAIHDSETDRWLTEDINWAPPTTLIDEPSWLVVDGIRLYLIRQTAIRDRLILERYGNSRDFELEQLTVVVLKTMVIQSRPHMVEIPFACKVHEPEMPLQNLGIPAVAERTIRTFGEIVYRKDPHDGIFRPMSWTHPVAEEVNNELDS